MRAHPAADVLGNTLTQLWDNPRLNQSYYYSLSVNEWVATDLLDADTGRNFTSWGEFYGPHMYDGDYFTTTVRSKEYTHGSLDADYNIATLQPV